MPIRKILRKFNSRRKISIEESFLNKSYQQHNIARLSHLDSLGLDLQHKTVIEFGAGIGDHTYFYLLKNCDVLSTDARQELTDFIRSRFGNKTMTLDVEKEILKIRDLPKFDIVHCYGLLYHISNPEEFLESLHGKGSLLLLETCVSSDYKLDNIYLVEENKFNPTQSYSGKGSRPTRQWIFNKLKEIYPFVYLPRTQPSHPEFPKDWTQNFSNEKTNLKRAVFIASEIELDLPALRNSIPGIYE